MYKINHCYKEFISNREMIFTHLNSQGLTLKFLWKNPDEQIISSFCEEPFFQLYFKLDIMFLLVKFKGLKWVDIPCVFTKNTRNFFFFEEKLLPVEIFLANSNTGKLYTYKKYTLPEGVTKAFVQAVHAQKDMPKKVAIEKINSIRSSFSSDEMSRLSLGRT